LAKHHHYTNEIRTQEWDVLKMKIRPPAAAPPTLFGTKYRTNSGATSKTAMKRATNVVFLLDVDVFDIAQIKMI